VIFKKQLSAFEGLLNQDEIVFVRGQIGILNETRSIRVSEIIPAKDVHTKMAWKATIRLNCNDTVETQNLASLLDRLKEILLANASPSSVGQEGSCPVFFDIETSNKSHAIIKLSRKFSISPTERIHKEIDDLLGEGHLMFTPLKNGKRK
jgi:DNA polymerase-3 subunit alpha